MIGQTLRTLRKERNIPVYKLAEVSGVAYQIIYSIENGETQNPGIETVRKLLRGMDATLSDLETTEAQTATTAA